MTRILLRLFNFPGLLLLTLLGIGIQTSLFSFWPLQYLQPDIVLLVVIWVALKRGFLEGGLMTLIIADVAEMHSASPQGMLMITYMAVFLMVRGLSRMVVIPHFSSLLTVTMLITAIWKLSVLGVLHLLGISANQWRHTLLYLFPGAVVEGLAGLWVYRWLEKYDWITYRNIRSEEAIEGEEELRGVWHS